MRISVPPQVCSTSSGWAAIASTSSGRRFSNGSLGSCWSCISADQPRIAGSIAGEQADRQQTEEESANMGEPRNTACIGRDRAESAQPAQQLYGEPIQQHQRGGQFDGGD